MAKKNSFVFYGSFAEAIAELDDTDKLQMYNAICQYGLDDSIEPNFTGYMSAVWKVIKPQIDANWQRYSNGKNGGAPKGNQNARKENNHPPNPNNRETTKNNQNQPSSNQNQTNVNDNVNEDYNDNENDNENYNYVDNGDCKGESKKNPSTSTHDSFWWGNVGEDGEPLVRHTNNKSQDVLSYVRQNLLSDMLQTGLVKVLCGYLNINSNLYVQEAKNAVDNLNMRNAKSKKKARCLVFHNIKRAVNAHLTKKDMDNIKSVWL